jgi:hypothetical protein
MVMARKTSAQKSAAGLAGANRHWPAGENPNPMFRPPLDETRPGSRRRYLWISKGCARTETQDFGENLKAALNRLLKLCVRFG